MDTHTIENISCQQRKLLEKQLQNYTTPSTVKNIFWFPIRETQLTQTQTSHLTSCGPFFVALELLDDALNIELLIRSSQKISCSCIALASSKTRNEIIASVKKLIPIVN